MLKKLLIFYCLCFSILSSAREYEYTYSVFTNSPMPGDWFFSRATCSGGSAIKTVNGKLPVNEAVFHTPGNSLELEFQNATGGHWQATIFHHDLRGMDHFKKAAFLSFWVYSSSEFNLPGLQLMMNDSSLSSVIDLPGLNGKHWQRVIVPVYQFKTTEAYQAENIIGVVFSQNNNTAEVRYKLYIDDIEFLPVSSSGPVVKIPEITSIAGYAMHIDIKWDKIIDENIHLVKIYRSEDGANYRAVGIQYPYANRYADFTGETGKEYSYRISFLNSDYEETALSAPVSVSTRPMTDDELLTMV